VRKRTEREQERRRRWVLAGKVLASEGELRESKVKWFNVNTKGPGKGRCAPSASRRYPRGVNVGTKGPGKGIAGEGDEQYGVATSTPNGLWRKRPLTCSAWKACVRYLAAWFLGSRRRRRV